jgi:hypothetical protein
MTEQIVLTWFGKSILKARLLRMILPYPTSQILGFFPQAWIFRSPTRCNKVKP